MKEEKVERAALTSVRLAVLIFSFVCLGFIVQERCSKYMQSAVVQRRYFETTQEPWFETAICFGPRFPSDTAKEYVKTNRGSVHAATDNGTTAHPGQESHDQLEEEATMSVNSVRSHRKFLGTHFNWTYDVFSFSSRPGAEIYRHLSNIKHRVSLGGVELNNSVMHSDLPFLFHYSVCRNYSYTISYKNSTMDLKKVPGDFVHEISMDNTTHKALLESGIAMYLDLYVYPRGDFTEFPLIADHIPYRVDLKTHELLNVVGEKTKKLERKGVWECNADRRHSYVNCLTWCLMRGLLDKTQCIMPMMIPYIYNTTHQVPNSTLASSIGKLDMNWKNVYPKEASLPWMRKYTGLKMCGSSQEFLDWFKKFSKVFFPRGLSKYPLSPQCSEECLPECREYMVYINAAGEKLIATSGEEKASGGQSAYINGVTFIHSTSLKVISEHWLYTWKQLFIDISGVLSFMLGLSIITIHDWCFTLSQWGLEKAQLIAIPDEEDDKGGEMVQTAVAAGASNGGIQVVVEAPSELHSVGDQAQAELWELPGTTQGT